MGKDLRKRIEEAAENYADDIATTEERGWMDRSDIYAIAKDAHLAGATIAEDHFREVTKMLIDKACEWLEMHVEYWAYEDGYFDVSAMLADFRKAMEENI